MTSNVIHKLENGESPLVLCGESPPLAISAGPSGRALTGTSETQNIMVPVGDPQESTSLLAPSALTGPQGNEQEAPNGPTSLIAASASTKSHAKKTHRKMVQDNASDINRPKRGIFSKGSKKPGPEIAPPLCFVEDGVPIAMSVVVLDDDSDEMQHFGPPGDLVMHQKNTSGFGLKTQCIALCACVIVFLAAVALVLGITFAINGRPPIPLPKTEMNESTLPPLDLMEFLSQRYEQLYSGEELSFLTSDQIYEYEKIMETFFDTLKEEEEYLTGVTGTCVHIDQHLYSNRTRVHGRTADLTTYPRAKSTSKTHLKHKHLDILFTIKFAQEKSNKKKSMDFHRVATYFQSFMNTDKGKFRFFQELGNAGIPVQYLDDMNLIDNDWTLAPTSPPRPSSYPTASPSFHPTTAKSLVPTMSPTKSPSSYPTAPPSFHPITAKSVVPTMSPTKSPTLSPTPAPIREQKCGFFLSAGCFVTRGCCGFK